MSEKTLHIVEWKYNPTMSRLEIALNNGKDLFIPEVILEEMFHAVPAITEAERIRKLLEKIHKIREKRVLEIEKIDEDIKKIRDQHSNVRKKLEGATDKLEVWKWNAQIKSLVAEKQLLDTRRHLCRLLYTEQGELMAELAELETGKIKRNR